MATRAISIEGIKGLTDGELIISAIGGRSDGFEELVHRYQRQITSYVFRMLGDYDSSLDVTQEVFIKVYNSLNKYSAEYKFSTWLYRIAHNAAIDHMRRNSVTPQSIETSSLHIDLISELKRINSLLCSVAYPILESAGALAPSRLRTSVL